MGQKEKVPGSDLLDLLSVGETRKASAMRQKVKKDNMI
jgi:hypothetical protein